MDRAATSRRHTLLLLAAALMASVVGLEWISGLEYSLGILYVLPIAVGAMALTRVQVVIAAIASAWIRSRFTPQLGPVEFSLRFAMAVLAYGGIGLLVGEISRHRRAMSAALSRLGLEQAMRQRAEEQLRDLADSSPAAILILGARAEVLMANHSAHELLGFEAPNGLVGVNLAEHVPFFAGALRVREGGPLMKTSATGWATRRNGQHFPVSAWFSTYGSGEGRRLAGILVDTSDEQRDRDRETFRHVYANNRLFASAVSHEIRNLCSALRVVTSNLLRESGGAANPDLTALGTLVESLARIASFDLSRQRDEKAGPLQIASVLEQLRLVIEPDWADIDGKVEWEIPANVPLIHGDPYVLLQVFLNLAQNSHRAVQSASPRHLRVAVSPEDTGVRVRVEDSGPGVTEPATLFQPFREGSAGTGLGLFISRNLVRSIGGDLQWVKTAAGCRFDVTLAAEERRA